MLTHLHTYYYYWYLLLFLLYMSFNALLIDAYTFILVAEARSLISLPDPCMHLYIYICIL